MATLGVSLTVVKPILPLLFIQIAEDTPARDREWLVRQTTYRPRFALPF